MSLVSSVNVPQRWQRYRAGWPPCRCRQSWTPNRHNNLPNMAGSLTASFIPGEVIAAAISALAVSLISLAIAFAHNAARLTRLEEWVRVHERFEDQERHERLARKDELP